MLALDHVFAFVDDPIVAAAACEAHGLHAPIGREHRGQGTWNRVVLFADHYVELISLRDRTEAERNFLRLDRRADHRLLGTSPFGICMRGRLPSTTSMREWRRYDLPAFEGGSLWIWETSIDDPRLPLLFCIVPTVDRVPRPRERGYPLEAFTHPCGARGIAQVELRGPTAQRARVPWLPAQIRVILADDHRMTLHLDGSPGFSWQHGPLELLG